MNYTKTKISLILYAAVSAVSFTYLILPQNSSVSVPVFMLIQIICLLYIVPEKRRLFMLLPVFAMAVGRFVNALDIWRVPNFLISIVLYSCMFLDFDIKKDSLKFISAIFKRMIIPFRYIKLPFRWIPELCRFNTNRLKRVMTGILIALPLVAIILVLLSDADMVFSFKVNGFIAGFVNLLSFNVFFKCLLGLFAGSYLLGVVFCAFTGKAEIKAGQGRLRADKILVIIPLAAVLAIYTAFVIIQFKYLFAGSVLPAGLNYTQYARRGFFELLWLSAVNIAGIITVVRLTKSENSRLIKTLCHYLCAVTLVLLASSFYRMFLYANADGFTRLRIYVMGFLIFEAAGLAITFIYIEKQNFSITLVYAIIALIYYTVLNLVPADRIIAKNQVGKYMCGERDEIEYVFTLSADALPELEVLLDKPEMEERIREFAKRVSEDNIPERWQRYNLSKSAAKRFE